MNKKISVAALIIAASVMMNEKSMAATDEYVAGVKDKTVSINGETGKVSGSGSESELKFLTKIYGGKHETASTTNNKIEATKITGISAKLFGGYTKGEGKVSQLNKVKVVGTGQASDAIKASIMAGVSVNGTASENEVLIQNIGELKSINLTKAVNIIGGKGKSATKNTVTVEGLENTGTSLAVRIWGGYAVSNEENEKNEASNNHVILKNISEIKDKSADQFALIYGGEGNSNGSKNTVEITGIADGATIQSNIIGSISKSGTLEENKVTLTNIKEIKSAYVIGAQATGVPPMGSDEIGSSVSGNTVEITGINSGAILSTEITGGLVQQGHAKNNQVNLANIKEINQKIYGGRDKEQGITVINSIRSVATPPTAVVTAPAIKGESDDAVASNNTVSIFGIGDGATLSADIYGGFVENESLRDYHGKTYIEDNAITLVNVRSNKDKETNIYAGFANSNDEDEVHINNNQIIVAGDTDLSNTNLYGGIAYEPQEAGKTERIVLKDDFTGNTLHIGINDAPWYNTKGKNAVKSLRGIQAIKFNAVNWDEDKAALTIVDESDLSKTTIDASGVYFSNLSALPTTDKKMTLVDTNGNDDGITKDNIVNADEVYEVGPSLQGIGEAKLDGTNVIYVIKGKNEPDPGEGGDSGGGTTEPVDPDSGGGTIDPTTPDSGGGTTDPTGPTDPVVPEKPSIPYLEAQPQTHNIMIGNIASLVSVNGGQNFVEKGIDSKSNFFVGSSSGKEKYTTGSHIETEITNAVVGMGNDKEFSNGNLKYMAFYEYGKGNYTVVNSIGKEGDGDILYQGLALAAKYRLKNDYYAEGSVRVGHVKNDADDVLSDKDGNEYDYNTSGRYLGGHVGLGRVMPLSDNVRIDTYGKYIFTNIEEDEFEIKDVKHKLDAIDSRIVKIGSEVVQTINNLEMHYGLALEHELDGKATGRLEAEGIESIPIESAEIKGTSVVGEIGVTLKPSLESAWEFDANVKGYAGQHEGFRASASVIYKF